MLKLTDFGFTPNTLLIPEATQTASIARITAVHRERYELVTDVGAASAKLKSSKYLNNSDTQFPTVGDFVEIDYNPAGDSRIIATLPRKTFFSRRDPTPGRGEQAIAANFDYVFIMQSLNHDFNISRLERYLALAWQSGAVPCVMLTKSDLVEDYTEQLRQVEATAVGVSVYAVSAKTGAGLDALSDFIKPRKTIVFLGSSGVGKSSLVNALMNDEVMAVKEIREDDSKGRHTTTHRQLFMLPSGAMLIDTPGMRELGLWEAGEGLRETFADVEEFLASANCKFSDCRHESEPGCAIKLALESGELSRERWENYLKLKQDVSFSEDKAEYLRLKSARNKGIAMLSKSIRKADGFKK